MTAVPATTRRDVPRAHVWLLAIAAGAIAAAIICEARAGVNVALWTLVAGGGLLVVQHESQPSRVAVRLPVALAFLLAVGASVTADDAMQAWLVIAMLMLLALATRLAALDPPEHRYGATFIATAPPFALLETLKNAARASVDGFGSIGVLRRRPALRGALIGAVVVIVFAALFAEADPIFARGRDAVTDLFTSLDFVPRLVFFVVASFGVLGAYAYASRTDAAADVAPLPPAPVAQSLDGRADRAVVLACAAAVCWIFVLLQLAYVATNAPARAGSGVTYAQYAHRGFAQLSVAATLAVLLVMEALGRARGSNGGTRLRAAAYALLAAVAGVLASAFHHVWLYENVYGFTTARVEAQAYMICILAVLVLCAVEIARDFDTARLARATVWVAVSALLAFAVWNDQAWVVRNDVARFAGTKRLDVRYLARLAPDAYPALLDALPVLPATQRQRLATELWPLAMCALREDAHWFEWNVSRSRARAAFASHGYAITPYPDRRCPAD